MPVGNDETLMDNTVKGENIDDLRIAKNWGWPSPFSFVTYYICHSFHHTSAFLLRETVTLFIHIWHWGKGGNLVDDEGKIFNRFISDKGTKYMFSRAVSWKGHGQTSCHEKVIGRHFVMKLPWADIVSWNCHRQTFFIKLPWADIVLSSCHGPFSWCQSMPRIKKVTNWSIK